MSEGAVESINVAKYFVDKANENGYTDITPLKLIKMVYIAHGWMMAIHDKELITEPVEAWRFGPVIHSLYSDIKHFGRKQVTDLSNKHAIDFGEEQKGILDQTYENYHAMSANQFIFLTHKKGAPWEQVYAGATYREIPNDVIKTYYKKLLDDSTS